MDNKANKEFAVEFAFGENFTNRSESMLETVFADNALTALDYFVSYVEECRGTTKGLLIIGVREV